MRYIKPGNSDLTVSRVRMGSRALAIRPDTAAGAQGPIMALSITKACGALIFIRILLQVYAIARICAAVAPQAFRHGAGKIVVKIVLVAVLFGVHAIGRSLTPAGVLPLTLPRLLERVLKSSSSS